MRALLNPVLDSILSLKTLFQATLLIPMTQTVQRDEAEAAASDSTVAPEFQGSIDMSFTCVDDSQGYLTGNGLGSLEIGAAYDD